MPAVLKAAGWQTAAFLSSFTVSEFFGFDRAFDTYDNGLARDRYNVLRMEPDGYYMWTLSAHQRRSDQTTDQAIKWLENFDKKHPFCLWVHYWDPHDYDPDAPLTQPPGEFSAPFLRRAKPIEGGIRKAMYAAEVAYVDRQFGRLIDKLKQMGHYNNTIIIVVADHGEGLGEHDWWGHTMVYEEQIRVPLIVRVPGWPTQNKITNLVRTIDIYPTILDALGIEDSHVVAGRTLGGLIRGEAERSRLAYADALNKFDLNSRILRWRPRDGNLYCATDGTWKLIWRYDEPDGGELYNIIDDPDEARNLFGKDSADAHFERLRGMLEKLKPFRSKPFPPDGVPEDPGALQALKSLGYIGDSPATDSNDAADEPP